jgi:selenocysteine lyase/cysteine desulfurase
MMGPAQAAARHGVALLEPFGTKTAARVSCYLYSTMAEIDRLGDALRRLAR